MLTYNTLVVLLGTTLLGMNAGLVGSFSVLRGRALLGDVLGHSALAGLCLAFLFIGRRSLSPMLAGALATALLSVMLMTLLRRTTRVKDDAVMGVVRSVLFGVGIVLISLIQNTVVEGSKAGLDSYILGKTAGMLASDVTLIAGVSLMSLITIVVLFKELRLASFDPDFARVQGWPAGLLDNLQMGLVAVTTVIGLPAVGAVLVAAMLILPGATMRFWNDRLGPLVVGAVFLGGVVGASGTLLSAEYSMLPAGPIIILAGTTLFVVSMLCAPRRGLTARYLADRRYRRELVRRKVLTSLYEAGESKPDRAAWLPWRQLTERHRWTDREAKAFLAETELDGFVERRIPASPLGPEVRLTTAGRKSAARRVRSDRLWSAFLDAYPDERGPNDELDLDALDAEIPPEVRDRLAAQLRAAGRLPEVDERSPT